MTITERQTVFSPCREYRYTLWRQWYGVSAISPERVPVEGNQSHRYVMFIGLNPSTADETKDDPTIRKCIGFAKRWGFGALCMTNLFAYRSTDPKKMLAHANPVGEDNQHHLLQRASQAGQVIAAWGTKGRHMDQDLTVTSWLAGIGIVMHALRLTKDGHPEHPLYVPYETKPQQFSS